MPFQAGFTPATSLDLCLVAPKIQFYSVAATCSDNNRLNFWIIGLPPILESIQISIFHHISKEIIHKIYKIY